MVFGGFLDQKDLIVGAEGKNAPNPNIIHPKITNKDKINQSQKMD